MTRWISNRRLAWAGAGLAACMLFGQPTTVSARDDDLSDLGVLGDNLDSDARDATITKSAKDTKSKKSKRGKRDKRVKEGPQEQPDQGDADAIDDSLDGLDMPETTEPSAPQRIAPKGRDDEAVSEQRTTSSEDGETEERARAADEGAAAEDAAEEGAAEEGEDVEAAPEPEEPEEEGPSVLIQPYAGAGVTTRSVRLPDATGGALRVKPGVAPAAEVGLRVVAWPSADFSLVFGVTYQSALFFAVTEHPAFALEKQVRARSERVGLDVAPSWLFGPIRLAVPLGVTIRTLWPEVHTSQTPGYSLVGPHAALDLALPLAEAVSLRLRPELHYIMLIDQQLRGVGVSEQGFALGGDVSVDVRLSQTWALGVNYRESHALLSTSQADITFHDAERYVTLRATGSF